MKSVVWLCVCVMSVVMANSSLAAGKLYRFKVDGKVIMKDYIPAEYSALGYDVLNTSGMLIERVPPAPTAEELAAKKAKEAVAEARKERVALQKEEDGKLLRLYERPRDVERARKRKTDEINTYIGLLQRRQDELDEKRRLAEADAKRISDGGRPIPDDIKKEIHDVDKALEDLHRDIEDRKAEFSRITREYAEQYERVRVLQLYPPGTLDDEVDYKRVDQLTESQQ
ncbi:hypothetical protein [Oceanobacter mangrovi]|uniref:hypothetical protein n=1 Tax=Oceanobacter mangrovi TaxID=2862510 RepID=UPI001C8D94EF|nr:hypothetical protein [Oceanobacter mangrovi]